MGLRFVNKDHTRCSASECLVALAKIGETSGGFGWLNKTELLRCSEMEGKPEDECESYLQDLEKTGRQRHGEWERYQ